MKLAEKVPLNSWFLPTQCLKMIEARTLQKIFWRKMIHREQKKQFWQPGKTPSQKVSKIFAQCPEKIQQTGQLIKKTYFSSRVSYRYVECSVDHLAFDTQLKLPAQCLEFMKDSTSKNFISSPNWTTAFVKSRFQKSVPQTRKY